MATLVLTAVGAAVGDFVLGPVGAALGQAAGALGGALLSPQQGAGARLHVGPRLSTMNGLTALEGAPVPHVYGRARIGGQIIWATRFFEQTNTTFAPGSGGKATGAARPATVDVSYAYFANFAVGLCEGEIAFVRRVWADGQELDLTSVEMRVYKGDETQMPDPLIVAKEQVGSVPAYRGLAYVVFERMPLDQFGNRIPQLTFEVVRPVAGAGALVRAVDIIPGATEFGYAPALRASFPGPGETVAENRNQSWAQTDWQASLDALQALCPNLQSVALVVCWFGDDLRAGRCTIAPRVDNMFKTLTWPMAPAVVADWGVAGLGRASARLVSQIDGASAYGGTPSDDAVVAALRDLKSRGLSTTFYPFVMMDIPPGSARRDPATDASDQPAFPWRGRLTCDPAPGAAQSVDGSPAAAAQVAAFFGSQSPSAGEWSYRRFILHCADLCAQAGGVDAFLVGSELVGLTRVRSAPGVYPAVAALEQLARDVKALMPQTKISYGADWTEYGAHVLGGGAEVRFPLDPLWASPAVDFVGVDAYWPLSDWRDGPHADENEAATIYDLDYLTTRIGAGEAYDWFYASDADRAAQIRTPISDGAAGKPWVFRQKDIKAWWSNAHVERVNGSELPQPTAWVAQSKPIWLTETGCPAVDRGANQPNVFPDAKSSESALPHFSRGFRDDLMQARFIAATQRRFDPACAGFAETDNPVSPLYKARMVDPARIHFWAWDARPFPAFPDLGFLWSDAPDWANGHWLNGRLEGAALDGLLLELAGPDAAPAALPAPQVEGFLDGYVVDRAMSARDAIDPLSDFFAFDSVVSSGAISFRRRAQKPVASLSVDDLAPFDDGALVRLARAQESELPHELAIAFVDADNDYQAAAVLSRRIEGGSQRRSETQSAVVTHRGAAQMRADIWLQDLWIARETAEFQTSLRQAALEPGDAVLLPVDGGARLFRIQRIQDGPTRHCYARALDLSAFDCVAPTIARRIKRKPLTPGPPHVVVLDLAIARNNPVTTQYVAACAIPWSGPLTVVESYGGAFSPVGQINAAATIGATLDALQPGRVGCFDRGAALRVKLYSGELAAVGDAIALSGRATMAIRGDDGAWEMFAFASAELIAPQTWRLTRLLRGLGGEEHLAQRTVAPGATVVLLDASVAPLAAGLSSVGVARQLRIGPVGAAYGDASFIALQATPTAKALLPYAPVQARAQANANGIVISFLRRSRIDGDAWESVDIPLGEESEAYSVSVARPGKTPRILNTTTTSILYAAADIAADFGAPPAALDLVIAQIGASVGPGFALNAHVTIQ
ncbi:MAG: glycoside hydrolase/phage tail family protein [Hyphomicrobiales bacterium]|nr:glycoside hydrolase/phage tail family protein [Hyphomicrobiales bacterium]